MKAIIESQFGYFPLVWMFSGRYTNAPINHINEKALETVYCDEISPFEELLEKDRLRTIYQRNIKILATELFKTKNNLSNHIMSQQICKRNSVGYSLHSTDLLLPLVKHVNYGLTVLRYLVQNYGILFLVTLKILEHLKNSRKILSHRFLKVVLVDFVRITYMKYV